MYGLFRQGHGVPGLVVPNLTMLQGGLGVRNVDAVYWTLWIELHFYVLIAVLAGIGITYRSCLVFMAVWMFAGLFANQADHKLLQVMLVPTWSPYFIAGMALYLIHRFGPTLLLWGYVAVSYLMALRWGAWRAETVFRGADEMVVAGVITAIFGGDDPRGDGQAEPRPLARSHHPRGADLPALPGPLAARASPAGRPVPGRRPVDGPRGGRHGVPAERPRRATA